MALSDALKQEKEVYPSWLDDAFWLSSAVKNNKAALPAGALFPQTLVPGAACKRVFLKAESRNIPLPDFPAREMLQSSVVFYPGAGTDGQPLRLFSSAHSAHAYIHVDYTVKRNELVRLLSDSSGELVRGYKALFVIEGGEKDFFTNGWLDLRDTYSDIDLFQAPELQWGVWAVLEREPQHDNDFGPKRILFCHLCCDAISAFASLWYKINGKRRTFPYAVVVEDSGFASNWAVFGSEKSQLFKIATRHAALPNWLLVAVGRSAKPWPGYARASEETEPGGKDKAERALFFKKDEE
jgi:hypothetical protein